MFCRLILRELRFQMTYITHMLDDFTRLLDEVYGTNVEHRVFGDFKPIGDIPTPAYYMHVFKKPVL